MLDPPYELLWSCDATPEELEIDMSRWRELAGVTSLFSEAWSRLSITEEDIVQQAAAAQAKREARERNQDELFAYRLMRTYSITIDQYENLLAEQDGKCAVCKRVPTDSRRLAVDHDHDCCPGKKSCGGCVRGLLCTGCNLTLGRMESC